MATNLIGANGKTSDPREQICWDNYVKSIAIGQENAYQSAIDAGYAIDTARNITMNDWFKERLGRLRRKDMLSKAEKVLDKTLTYNTEDAEGKIMTDLLRVQTDVAKHITKTLGKEDYSERKELTGANGEELQPILVKFINGDND